MRSVDEIVEIVTELDDTIYYLIRRGLDEYFFHGNRNLLEVASERSGLSIDEIMAWYNL